MEPRSTPLTLIVVLSVIITALVFGGGTYAYEKNQLDSQTADLQSQINSLKSQLTVASATATPTASALPSPSPSSSSCAASNLKLALAPSTGGAAAGTAYYDLVMTNNSSTDCVLSGYPKVAIKDTSGTTLGTAGTISGQTVSSFSVTPGASAYALISFPNPGNFDAGTCKPASALTLAIADAETPAELSLNNSTYAYSEQYCGNVNVGPFSSAKQ